MTYAPQETPYQAGYGNYASWIQRVGGNIIDSLVIVPFGILAATVGIGTDEVTAMPKFNAFYFIFILLGAIVGAYNRWFLQGKTGQSWGKKVVGLRLIGEATGQPIGAGQAFLRDICHIVDGVICYIGFLWPLWDAKKQTLADKILSTIVVK
jgi:uncharacterized RDD family membrane protein YckC